MTVGETGKFPKYFLCHSESRGTRTNLNDCGPIPQKTIFCKDVDFNAISDLLRKHLFCWAGLI